MRRSVYFRPCLAMKSCVRRMISSGFKSSAKCPASKMWYLGSGVILLVRFPTGYRERSIVTPPKNKEWRLVVAKPLLPFRVGLEVILVVVKEIQLNIALSRLVQEVILVHPQIGVVLRGIWRSADVPLAGGFKGQQVASHLGLMSLACPARMTAELPKEEIGPLRARRHFG